MSFRFHAPSRFAWLAALVWIAASLQPVPVSAKRMRLDDESLETASRLAKDREQKLSGAEAMSDDDFQGAWKAFTGDLEKYEGNQIQLKKFGNDVRFRKGFSHILYMALKTQVGGLALDPPVQALVARHPFLQELAVVGSCYTGGDPFPKKMSDLLEASSGMRMLLIENFDAWDKKNKQLFEKAFQK